MHTQPKRKKTTTRTDQIDLTIQRTEHFVSNFLERHTSTLLYAAFGLVVVLLLLFKVSTSGSTGSVDDYILLSNKISKLESDPSNLKFIEKTLKSHPELYARYSSPLAQSLVILDEGDQAKFFADKSIARLKTYGNQQNSFYAQGTLLIANGEYEKALEGAKRLKPETLEGNSPLLTAMNLLRIAILEQKAGTKKGETEAWTELQAFLKKPGNERVAEQIRQLFKNGKSEMEDFVSMRSS